MSARSHSTLPGVAGSRYRLYVAHLRVAPLTFHGKQRLQSMFAAGALILSATVLSATLGCQNYSDQLARGQGYYEQNQYEAALAVWRNLEADQNSLTRPEVVRYCYLRGMTDFRLGYRADARYFLGLARAGLNRVHGSDGGETVALQPDESKRLDETLAELNARVYGTEAEDTPQALGDKCAWTSDCESGFACQDGMCIRAEGPEAASGSRTPSVSKHSAPPTEPE